VTSRYEGKKEIDPVLSHLISQGGDAIPLTPLASDDLAARAATLD
jgi:hypothetical protein